MIACSFATAHISIHAGIGQPVTNVRAQQQVVEAKPCIPLPSVAHVVPERVDALAGMRMPDSISPTPAEKPFVGCPASEAASELVRVTRKGTPVPTDGVLARLLDASRVVAELESRPQEAELLVAIHRWNAAQS